MAEALGEAANPRPCIDIHAGQAGYSWWMDEGQPIVAGLNGICIYDIYEL